MAPQPIAHKPPSVHGIVRQEYWGGLLFPSSGDLLDPGIEPMSLVSPALAGGFFTTEPPGKPTVTLKRNKTSDPEILLPSEHRAT